MFIKKAFVILSLLCSVFVLKAQFKAPTTSIETGTIISHGNQSPFWLSANKYGFISFEPGSVWMRSKIKTEIDWSKRFDYSYGIDAWGRYDQSGKLGLQQAWVKTKIFFVTAYIGRMEEMYGNQDSTLSSGGLMWSGNATPLPKISIQTEQWTPVPFTYKYFEFKGGISHGWFGKQEFVSDGYLHHKYAYIRFGGKLPVHLHFGFHHFAQWGGTSHLKGKFPNDFKAFKDIFFARKSATDILPDGTPIANSLGNHMGSRNYGLDIELKKYKICSYWQTIFEDGSGKALRNIKDGLWGLTIKAKKEALVSGVLYEFLHTTDQSGRFNWDPVTMKEYGGNDNYFNHGYYNFGWTYNGLTVGNPLITSPLYTGNNLFEYIRNNRVIAHHFGLEGSKKYFSYKLLYTYSLNFGTNFVEFSPSKQQNSILISTLYTKVLPYESDLGVNLGIDLGKMYGNNLGLQMVVKKTF